MYLNKSCFNGFFKIDSNGNCSFPGTSSNPAILNEANLRACISALQHATITCSTFQHIPIEKDAFYYLDPPYHNTFDSYAAKPFSEDNHRELAQFCRAIHTAGGYFMLSNSDTPFVRTLFKGFTIERIYA